MIKPLRQIFMPNENTNNEYVDYENQLKPRININSYTSKISIEELRKLYEVHQENIIKMAESEVTNYLSDEGACNNDKGMFPQWKCLTGDWYVGTICIEGNDEEEVDGSIVLRFTENFKRNDGSEIITDYLGMEVCFYWDEEENQFIFDGINTASI